jgi:hypothetical protein
MQIAPTNPLEPLCGDDIALGIIAILSKTAAKSGVTVAALLFFRSLNRLRLRVSAETRSRWLMIRCKKQQKQLAMLPPTPPAGLAHLINASEH